VGGRRTAFVFLLFPAVLIVLVATSCKKDSRAIQKTYQDYRQAILDGNAEVLKGYLSKARRDEIPAEDYSAALGLLKSFVPPDVVVRSIKIDGQSALLAAEGTLQGEKAAGTVRFIREADAWKVDKEDWEVTLSGGPAGFASAAEPFFSTPQSPPRPFMILDGHQGEVSGLAFTPDGRHLISASYGDYSLRSWDLSTGRQVSSTRTANRVRSIALSGNKEKLLAADAYGVITSYPLRDGEIGAAFASQENAGDSIALSPDSKFMAATGYQKPVDIWDVEAGAKLKTLKEGFDVRVLTFSRSGKSLAGAGEGRSVAVWETGRWKSKVHRISRVMKESTVVSLDFSPDDRFLATGHNDSSIVILDLKEKRELHNWFVKDASTLAVKFSSDGSSLATAHQDKAVYIWDLETGYPQAKLERHAQPVVSLAFSPDGKVLATGGEDRKIILWKAGAQGVPEETAVPEAESAAAPGPEFLELEGRGNLVKNPSANREVGEWRAEGEVSIERSDEGDTYFAIRYGGMLRQDIDIAGAEGRTILFIALSASERIEEDGDQTGLPYLSGEMAKAEDDHIVTAHLSAQSMMHSLKTSGEWGTVWGIFQVPPDTGRLRLFLGQADGGKPQNGSAAWFDDVGVFLFDSEDEARTFASLFEKRYPPSPRPASSV